MAKMHFVYCLYSNGTSNVPTCQYMYIVFELHNESAGY